MTLRRAEEYSFTEMPEKKSGFAKLSQRFFRALRFSAPRPVSTELAPKPVGPYSQAVEFFNTDWLLSRSWLICSGQIPLDPKTSQIVGKTVGEQTEQTFKNILAVLSAGGKDLSHVVKTTVFLTDISRFEEFNEVYASYFKERRPARSLVEVSALPKGALVEIEVWAF